jgi:outer membrane lipoprotein-sorting protein
MKLLISIFLFVSISTYAQEFVAQVETSDESALAILEKIKTDFEAHKNHKIDFEFLVEYPGEQTIVELGTLLQSGDKFELELEDKKIISNNKTVWLYLKEANEVQINDADFGDEGEFMSPSTLFNLYQSKEYIFAISSQNIENGIAMTQIECKPLDPNSEYSKMRLSIQDKGNKVISMKIFSKDGSRFTMKILNHKLDVTVPVGAFEFNAADYHGVIIEDLRF